MDDEKQFENLRGIEAEALGLPATADRSARKQAIERLRAKLADARTREPDDTFSVSLPDRGRWRSSSRSHDATDCARTVTRDNVVRPSS